MAFRFQFLRQWKSTRAGRKAVLLSAASAGEEACNSDRGSGRLDSSDSCSADRTSSPGSRLLPLALHYLLPDFALGSVGGTPMQILVRGGAPNGDRSTLRLMKSKPQGHPLHGPFRNSVKARATCSHGLTPL